MPNSPSAKKRLRQDVVRRDINRAAKSQIRKKIRSVREAVAAGDLAKAEASFKDAARHLDRAGGQNVIHANAAARHKSRLHKLIVTAKKG